MWLLPVDAMGHRWVTLLFDYPIFFSPGLPPAAWLCSPMPHFQQRGPFTVLQLFLSALTHFSGLNSGSFPSLLLLRAKHQQMAAPAVELESKK